MRDNPQLYRRVGVMSEHEAVYGFYTGRQFVEFAGRMHGLSPLAARPRNTVGECLGV